MCRSPFLFLGKPRPQALGAKTLGAPSRAPAPGPCASPRSLCQLCGSCSCQEAVLATPGLPDQCLEANLRVECPLLGLEPVELWQATRSSAVRSGCSSCHRPSVGLTIPGPGEAILSPMLGGQIAAQVSPFSTVFLHF